MRVRCPYCKHHIPLYRLRGRFICEHCGNPLRAHLTAPVLTYAFLFVVVNGFIGLVWRAFAMPQPAPIPGADGPVQSGVTAGAQAALTEVGVPWLSYTVALIFLGCALSWVLFVWVFSSLVQVVLDAERLPGGVPRHRHSSRHYHDSAPSGQ